MRPLPPLRLQYLLLSVLVAGAFGCRSKPSAKAEPDATVDPAAIRSLDDPSRDAWQRPQELVDALALNPDAIVADVGAGTGYFTLRLAEKVPSGRAWGVDLDPGLVRFLGERARAEGFDNVYAILGTPTNPLLPERVDLILLVNTYHLLSSRVGYVRNLKSFLRPGGRLVVVDYKMGLLPVGPPDEQKVPEDLVREELEEAGLRFYRSLDLLPHQYVLVYQHPELPPRIPDEGAQGDTLSTP